MNIVEIIEMMIEDDLKLTKTAELLSMPLSTLNDKVRKAIAKDEDLKYRYKQHVSKIQKNVRISYSNVTKEVMDHLMGRVKISNLYIMDYLIKNNIETPVIKVIEVLEQQGKCVIRL